MTRLAVCLWVLAAAAAWLLASAPHSPGNPVSAYGPSYDSHLHMLQEIRDELRGIRSDMLAQRGGAAAPDGASLLAQNCASCHGPARAEERGNGFVIAPGQLSVNDRRRMIGKVSRGEMPPGRGLPAAERKALADYLSKTPVSAPKETQR